MAINSSNWAGCVRDYELPSRKDLDTKTEKPRAVISDFEMFWQCEKCKSSVIFYCDSCPQCDYE